MRVCILFAIVTLASCAAEQARLRPSGVHMLPHGEVSPMVSSPGEAPQAKSSRLSVSFGNRELDEGDWEPVETQSTLGLSFSSARPEGLGWELGFLTGDDTENVFVAGLGNVRASSETTELYAGGRYEFGSGSVAHPYLGGGLSLVTAEASVSASGVGSYSDDDDSLGLYLHGGVLFDVSSSVSLGLDYRILTGTEVELGGAEGDVDGGLLSLVLAFGF